MAQLDDGRGNLYEQVLEYAKKEMDEAASKMAEIQQSIHLLEARVEAAKAVYQAVASRLNLEDESEGASLDQSYPDVPVPAPEPPPAVPAPAPAPAPEPEAQIAAAPTPAPETQPSVAEPQPTESPVEQPSPEPTDLDMIRQHLAAKADAEATSAPAESPSAPEDPTITPLAPEPVAAAPPSASEDDSFSMQLIRQRLEQKAQQDTTESPPAPETPAAVPAREPPQSEENGGGLSDADRELIGAYLRSKQN